MACYVCGGRTDPDHPFRRDINTGTGYTGWRITNSRLTNSYFFSGGRGPRAPRSYYGLRTVCENCAKNIDETNAIKEKRMWIIVPLLWTLSIMGAFFRGFISGLVRKR